LVIRAWLSTILVPVQTSTSCISCKALEEQRGFADPDPRGSKRGNFGVLKKNFKCLFYTDKKENKFFLTYQEIQSGAVAKSYMRKGFQIYEKISKYFPIYEEAVSYI
jgi:hypothetical protein